MADQISINGGFTVPYEGDTTAAPSNDSDAQGRRVRLRPKPSASAINSIYGGNGLLTPLRATNGMVWPYQPTISWSQSVIYEPMDMVHVNQEIMAYNRTPAAKFTVTGDWSVQNQQEGLYALACIHFLRSVTKMYFGENDPNAGTPPPVLQFDAYGQYMFNQLPVIVTLYSVGLPNDVDYVPVDLANAQTYGYAQTRSNIPGYSNIQTTPSLQSFVNSANQSLIAARVWKRDLLSSGDGYVWLPAVFSISVELTVQNTAYRLRQFDLDSFRTGQLMKQGRWI